MSKPSRSWLIRNLLKLFEQLKPSLLSSEYLIWRNRFMWRRIGLLLWVGLAVHLNAILLDIYRVFYLKTGGDYTYENRNFLLLEHIIFTALLLVCFVLHKAKFGHRYPNTIFLGFSWNCTLVLQIFRTFNLPDNIILNSSVWVLLFLGQATLIPICWRLHFISQIVPFGYFLVNTLVRGYSSDNNYAILRPELIIVLFWFFFICNLGVYLYEKLQIAEFESRRELKVFLHAITHDLRTPLMGNSIVLQRLLKKSRQTNNN